MQFALLNECKDQEITPMILAEIAAAVERQLYEHYAPFWESSGAPVIGYPRLRDIPDGACIVVILDDAEQAGYLGYHDVTNDGRPYSRVFWNPIKNSGGTIKDGFNSLSAVISHEVLETIGDPYASFWATNPKTNKFHALELCDAVESEAYEIDGVSVSNFVGPRFFRKGPGPYDWMSQMLGLKSSLNGPFDTAPGGYQIVATDMDSISNIYGANYPEWKKETKTHKASRTMKRGAKWTPLVQE